MQEITQFEAAKIGNLEWFKTQKASATKIDFEASDADYHTIFSLVARNNDYQLHEWIIQESPDYRMQRDFLNFANEILSEGQIGLFKEHFRIGYLEQPEIQRRSLDLTHLLGLQVALEYPKLLQWTLSHLSEDLKNAITIIDQDRLDDYALLYDNPNFYLTDTSKDNTLQAEEAESARAAQIYFLMQANKPSLLQYHAAKLPQTNNSTHLLSTAALKALEENDISNLKILKTELATRAIPIEKPLCKC